MRKLTAIGHKLGNKARTLLLLVGIRRQASIYGLHRGVRLANTVSNLRIGAAS